MISARSTGGESIAGCRMRIRRVRLGERKGGGVRCRGTRSRRVVGEERVGVGVGVGVGVEVEDLLRERLGV